MTLMTSTALGSGLESCWGEGTWAATYCNLPANTPIREYTQQYFGSASTARACPLGRQRRRLIVPQVIEGARHVAGEVIHASVPKPPGMAINASERASIVAFRWRMS